MSKILDKWQRTTSPTFLEQLPRNWQRRAFLRKSLQAAAVVTVAPGLATLLSGCQRDTFSAALAQAPWPTLSQVQQHLFPADGNGPGAIDIHANAYLYWAINTPDFDADERQYILDGATQLEAVSLELHQHRFIELATPQRESVLQTLAETGVGDRWLGALLTYILEALLCDPVYGGNPNGIGWQWLEHTPGFPRPPHPYTDLWK